MQIRVTRIKRNGRTYEYAQLVESYRREHDGMPMHRVVANLGALSALEVENLRVALQAGRDKQKLVAPRTTKQPRPLPQIVANLRYLDAAVLLELWNEWGLMELLGDVLPDSAATIPGARVVAALAIQRCIDPGSKLYATRWFPRTALPELLDVDPTAFNNTRLHRVLDELESAESTLMAKLARRVHDRHGAFLSLFLDVTDTWFVGEGPGLAAPGKTKEGLVRRKIGVALLCDERGYPLRWDVVSGASADCTVMTRMLESVAGVGWVGDAPIVCDRAMGRTSQLAEMARLNLRFLTALTITEMGAYAEQLPHEALSNLIPEAADDPEQWSRGAKSAAEAVHAAGMKRVDDDLFVLDLGIIEREVEPSSRPRTRERSPQEAMRLAREIQDDVATGRFPSQAAAARTRGFSKALASKYCGLRALPDDIQREILTGKAEGHPLARLLAIAGLPDADQQREAFWALGPGTPKALPAAREPEADVQRPERLRVRVIAYFNPERFVEQRLRGRKRLEEIQAYAALLNEELARPHSRRKESDIVAAVDRHLRRFDLLGAFSLRVHQHEVAGRPRFSVELTLDENEWSRRNRYDGFTVLVASPSLAHTPEEMCCLYRSKDTVEKDFQTIKSLVELRPVRHRTDEKVRAHVSVCMLALLLERTLQQKLKGQRTARAALELLEECRLNRCDASGEAAYVLTQPTSDQLSVLRSLRLLRLADQAEVADRLAPR